MRESDVHEPIRSTRLYGLLALNGALLLLLGAVTFSPMTTAQVRARGSYTMAAGRVKGAQANVVYIVDTSNREMIALSYDANQKELLGVGYRNLAADADSLHRRGSSR